MSLKKPCYLETEGASREENAEESCSTDLGIQVLQLAVSICRVHVELKHRQILVPKARGDALDVLRKRLELAHKVVLDIIQTTEVGLNRHNSTRLAISLVIHNTLGISSCWH